MSQQVETRIPVILTGHALRSLRDSGYSFPAAVAEVVDNSIEANANEIRIRLYEAVEKGRKHIHQVAVSDDGSGMDSAVLSHYPQVGFSTRYMSLKTIGKYGVGAKLAALNFGRRMDVWSRTNGEEPWRHVYFDLDEALEQEETGGSALGLEPPSEKEIPEELAALLPAKAGTLVVWSKVDRLEEGRLAADANGLRVELQRELSRIFRYFLDGGIKIWVDDTLLLPHDPLFLMTGTWADTVLADHLAREAKERSRDGGAVTGKPHFGATRIAHEPVSIGGSSFMLTVTVYPKEVVRTRGKGGDDLAKKLRVQENQGSISFVRLNREINYTNVPYIFHRAVEEPDRFVGIEVSFKPDLDEFFGVRNVKRGVEPHGQLRQDVRKLLRKYVGQARDRIEEIWGEAATADREHESEHAPVVEAAKDVNRTLPKSRVRERVDEADRERALRDLAKDVGKKGKEQEEYIEKIRDDPFVLESMDFPGSAFLDVQHLSGQVIIRLNTRHRFYREMWDPIRTIATSQPGSVSGDEAVRAARRTLEALQLMVVAYGKAESMDENPRDRYGDLRGFWGQFLDTLMGKIKDVV